MTTERKTELRAIDVMALVAPCPWCGVRPEYLERDSYGFYIHCTNGECPVGPSMARGWDLRTALEMWNVRHEMKPTALNFMGESA